MRQLMFAFAAVGAALCWTACNEKDPSRFGCVADKDCRAPRICTAGVCMNPPGSDPGTDAGATVDAAAPQDGSMISPADAATTFDLAVRVDVGGTADAPAPGAVVKFCNNIKPPGGENHPLTIVFDTAPGKPRLTADSGGACSPPVPQPCLAIPTGPTVPFTLLDATGMVGSGAITDVAPGDQWLLRVEADANGQGAVYGDTLQASLSCAAVGSFTGSPDGGTAGDAASRDAGGPVCTSVPSDPPCSRCIDQMCCAEFTSCLGNAACVGLASCVDACAAGDTACTNTCVSRYPSGVAPLNAYLGCGNNRCATACGGSAADASTG